MKIWTLPQDIVTQQGFVTLIWGDKDGNVVEVQKTKNLITTAAKNSWASAFRGSTTNNQGIGTYHAVGTGTTAPALGNTTLEAEIFRKLVSVRSSSGNVASFQTFFTTSEANGTLKELGLFGDSASGTADTGTLFARVAIDRVKTSNDTLTVLHQVVFG